MKLSDAYDEVFGNSDKDRYKPPFFEQHEGIDSLAHWIESEVAAVLVYKTFFTYRAVTLSRAPVVHSDSFKIRRIDVDVALEFIRKKNGTVDPVLMSALEAKRGLFICEVFIKLVTGGSNRRYDGASVGLGGGGWHEHSSTGYRVYKKGREYTLHPAQYVDASWAKGKPLFVRADSLTIREFINDYFRSVTEQGKEKRMKDNSVHDDFFVRSGDLPDEVTDYLKRKGLLFSV